MAVQPLREAAAFFRFLFDDARDPRFGAIAGAAVGLIAIGSAVFWFLEDWTALDAVYFSVMTLTTVGFGDVAPRTAPGKVFTMVYVVLGVGLFGGFLALVARRETERLERREPVAETTDHGGGSG